MCPSFTPSILPFQRVRQGEGARGEQGRLHAAQGEGKVGQGNERVSWLRVHSHMSI